MRLKHGPANVLVLFFHGLRNEYRSLAVPCSLEPFGMAQVGYSLTPMSRLSQQGSRCRSHTGKTSDFCSPYNVSNTKAPKRKTLCSRYTAALASKRRKLGLSTIRGSIDAPGESDQGSELQLTAESPKSCNVSEVSPIEKQARGSIALVRKRKAKAGGKERSRARNASIRISKCLQADVSPRAKLLDSEEVSNEETHFGASCRSEPLKGIASSGAGFPADGSRSRASIPCSIENASLKLGEARASPITRKTNIDSMHAAPRPFTRKQELTANRRRSRKTRDQVLTIADSDPQKRISKTDLAVHAKDTSDLLTPTGSQGQRPGVHDEGDCRSLIKKDGSPQQVSFLRPRRKARKKSNLEEHHLPPWDYVGKRVVVYWPHAKAWYAGKVITYEDESKKHKIKYDDGDEECISFRRHKVLLEKSVSGQAAEDRNKEFVSTQMVQTPKEGMTGRKPVKDLVDDFCPIEDNALLSVFASRKRSREIPQETSCNGSALPASAVKELDSSVTNTTTVVQKSFKRSICLTAQDNTGRSSIFDRVTGAGKEAFVYVRRTKGRRKLDVQGGDMLDGRIHGPEVTGAVHEQEFSRKRKSYHSIPQQQSQEEFSECRFFDDESSCSDAPATLSTLGNGTNAFERTSRKRNKRSLKKLVDKAALSLGTDVNRQSESRLDVSRKPKVGRPKKKLAMKNKLNNVRFGARNMRLRTRGRFTLQHNPEVPLSRSDAAIFCHNKDKLCTTAAQAIMHVSKGVSLFVHTINLKLPAVVPNLFTWQLFSIFSWTRFCDGGSFDGLFLLNGTMEDWKNIFRIFLRIIKVVPLSAYLNGRQWQCIILHELWTFLRRHKLAQVETLASLPSEVEILVSEHLFDASAGCRMSSREILNFFVYFLIKPYILATLCDKGLSIQVVIQQFLLFVRRKGEGTDCFRQSVRRFPLKATSTNVDEGFAMHLMQFLRPTDWCTERGLFSNQMEEWINTTSKAGYAEICTSVTALERLDHSMWQVILSHTTCEGNPLNETKQKTFREKLFRLEQESSGSEFGDEFCLNCSRYGQMRKHMFGQKCGLQTTPSDSTCMNSALLFVAGLQKRLSTSAQKFYGFMKADFRPIVVSSHNRKASAAYKQVEAEQLYWQPDPPVGASETKLSAGLWNEMNEEDHTFLSSHQKCLVPVVCALPKRVKLEPDMNISRRNSSITTESLNTGIKEESSVEMHELRDPSHVCTQKAGLVSEIPLGHTKGSEHMDRDCSGNCLLRDVQMARIDRPHFHSERQRSVLKRRPTYFCVADVLLLNHEHVERETGARVELRSNADSSFQISVHIDGNFLEKKILEGGMLSKNPSELCWRSGNGWVLEFPDKEQWELFRCMFNELCSQAIRATSVKEIPIPVVKELKISNGDLSGSAVRPFFAITSQGDEIEMSFRTGRVLYDLDSEDEAWIVKTNKAHTDLGCEIVSDNTLERVIDLLEKESYRRETAITIHDAIELCQDLAAADCVRAVHAYWMCKRRTKGMSLVRCFQPPLWEQYQDELQLWENRIQQFSSESQSMLLDRYPRPIMSAFCLQSRTYDSLDNGKRMLRQRSQRKIRPTSRSCFDDTHRLPVCRDTDFTQHLTDRSEYSPLAAEPYQHLDLGHEDEGLSESTKAARDSAFEARRVAKKRALKLQRRFLEFDLALQRAWALLMDLTVSGGDGFNQSEPLGGAMRHLLTSCSSILSRENDWSEEDPPSDLGQICLDVGEEFLEAFSKQCSLSGKSVLNNAKDNLEDPELEEASSLLPVSVKGSPYGWNGSSLL